MAGTSVFGSCKDKFVTWVKGVTDVVFTSADGNEELTLCLNPLKDLRLNDDGSWTAIYADGSEGETIADTTIPADGSASFDLADADTVDGQGNPIEPGTPVLDIYDGEGNYLGSKACVDLTVLSQTPDGVTIPVNPDNTQTITQCCTWASIVDDAGNVTTPTGEIVPAVDGEGNPIAPGTEVLSLTDVNGDYEVSYPKLEVANSAQTGSVDPVVGGTLIDDRFIVHESGDGTITYFDRSCPPNAGDLTHPAYLKAEDTDGCMNRFIAQEHEIIHGIDGSGEVDQQIEHRIGREERTGGSFSSRTDSTATGLYSANIADANSDATGAFSATIASISTQAAMTTATTISALNSVVNGSYSSAHGDQGSVVNGNVSVVGGISNVENGGGNQVRSQESTVDGNWNSVFGTRHDVDGGNNAVSGSSNIVSSGNSEVSGSRNEVYAPSSTASGQLNTIALCANNSHTSGEENLNEARNSSTFGWGLHADTYNQTVVGRFNKPVSKQGPCAGTNLPTDYTFVVGSGGPAARRNTLAVQGNASVMLAPASGSTGIAAGDVAAAQAFLDANQEICEAENCAITCIAGMLFFWDGTAHRQIAFV